MSNCYSDKFSNKGGKCPTVILTSFGKKRRKMSYCHSDKFSKKGGKCPTIILTSFGKKEENVLVQSDKLSQIGGKCPTVILDIWEENFLESIMEI